MHGQRDLSFFSTKKNAEVYFPLFRRSKGRPYYPHCQRVVNVRFHGFSLWNTTNLWGARCQEAGQWESRRADDGLGFIEDFCEILVLLGNVGRRADAGIPGSGLGSAADSRQTKWHERLHPRISSVPIIIQCVGYGVATRGWPKSMGSLEIERHDIQGSPDGFLRSVWSQGWSDGSQSPGDIRPGPEQEQVWVGEPVTDPTDKTNSHP